MSFGKSVEQIDGSYPSITTLEGQFWPLLNKNSRWQFGRWISVQQRELCLSSNFELSKIQITTDRRCDFESQRNLAKPPHFCLIGFTEAWAISKIKSAKEFEQDKSDSRLSDFYQVYLKFSGLNLNAFRSTSSD